MSGATVFPNKLTASWQTWHLWMLKCARTRKQVYKGYATIAGRFLHTSHITSLCDCIANLNVIPADFLDRGIWRLCSAARQQLLSLYTVTKKTRFTNITFLQIIRTLYIIT